MLTPTGPFGPYSASSVMPATTVGSANGRSISALPTRLPGNSSRTSTHATSVPNSALIAATIRAAPSVSFSALTDWRLETVSQKCAIPPSVDFATTAARGRSTIRLSHTVVTPRPSIPGRPTAATRRRRGSRTDRASLGSGDRCLVLDLGDGAVLRVEEVGHHLVPATEVVDGEQRRGRRELRLELRRDRRHDRAVAVLGEHGLRLGRPEVVEERLGLRLRLRRDRDRVLDQDRLIRSHVVDLLALLLGGDRLVLVAEQHVALAAGERLQRVARRLVLYRDVLGEQLLEVRERLGGRLAELQLRAVGGHDVPARATRRERVRREDLDAGLQQVRPGLDVLRVALAHEEGRDGVGDDALVRLAGGPVGRDEVRLHEARDVRGERERHDVGRQPGLDRAALVARGAVGRAERRALSIGGCRELRRKLVVDDLRGRVGDERQLRAPATAAGGRVLRIGSATAAGHDKRDEGDEGGAEHACLHGASKVK